MAFKTEGIVLHYRTLKGADRMYDVLSPEYGRMNIVARSVAKSSSKMGGMMELFSHVKIMVGRGHQDHLAGARTIEGYGDLREDWFNFILTSSLIELVLAVNVSGSAAREEFDLLKFTLGLLKSGLYSQQEKIFIARIFLWKMLALSGWKPELTQCAISHKPLGEKVYYQSPKGFVDAEYNRNGILIENELRKFLSDVVEKDNWDILIQAALKNGLRKKWLNLTQQYYQDIISKPLQSLKLFEYV